MATTADYLNKLITQKNTLADNLVTKGVDATHDETLETLVPKVLEISSEIPTFCYDGIVGFFDTASVDISNGIWQNGIDGYNDITLNGGAIEDNSLKAVGGDIGDFATADTPKVIYIVVKKDEQEVDSCIIGIGRNANNNSYGFSLWLTGENYVCSQSGAPYINDYTAELGKYHCIAIACQSTIDSKNGNGIMFFVDGNLAGFLSGHLYGDYAGFVSMLREYCKSYMYLCENDTFIRSIAIGTQEHSVQQILQNSKYLMQKYM